MSALARTTEINCDTRAANGDCINGGSRTRTKYLHDGQNPVALNGTMFLEGPGLDEIYGKLASTGATSYLRDALGSTIAVSNSSAATTSSYAYSSYGSTVITGTADSPFQYTARENDAASNLYYYRARYYSPQLGRFISEDPIGLNGGINAYAYAAENPISYRDPSGKDPFLALVGVIAGTGYGIVNGIISGDSRNELIADAVAGAAQGGLIGLTDGLSLLESVGFNAVANAGIESYRQIANSAITGCNKFDERGVAFAAAGGVLGDLVGGASSLIRAEGASIANHAIFLPEEYDNLAKFISLNVEGIAQTPYSAVTRLSQ